MLFTFLYSKFPKGKLDKLDTPFVVSSLYAGFKGSELKPTLNGDNLVSQGREDKTNLITTLKEMLETMTYDKLMELQSQRAEFINKQLRYVPMPNGLAIFMG